MRLPARALAAASLLLASCGDNSAPAIVNGDVGPTRAASALSAAEASQPTVARWDATRCGDDLDQNARMEHSALMRRSPDALQIAFGPVTARETFRVGEPVGIFYGELGRHRSGLRHSLDGLRAQVLTWTRQSCNFSVFFVEGPGAWRAVKAFEWAVGADF